MADGWVDEAYDRHRGTALGMIEAERRRQIEAEGWTVEHDDLHSAGDLAWAAAAYCTRRNSDWPWWGPDEPAGFKLSSPVGFSPAAEEAMETGKDGRVRELVKAGALIVAEIERLQRAALEDNQ